MLKFIRGTDRGNAIVTALVFILALSFIFMSVVPRIIILKRYAGEYKDKVIRSIEQSNKEIINEYDLY